MQTVWKFSFEVNDNVELKMPKGAKVLSVASDGQMGPINLWALVDPRNVPESRHFSLRGTGHPAIGVEELPFIGTVVMMGGDFVVHIWEGRP